MHKINIILSNITKYSIAYLFQVRNLALLVSIILTIYLINPELDLLLVLTTNGPAIKLKFLCHYIKFNIFVIK
jgi:hypothetical protein